MTETAFFWIAGIFAVIVAAIGGAFWKHVVEDGKVRERLASLEADNAVTKAEVRSLRDRWHHFRDETMRDAWKLFQDWKDEMIERFRREKDGRDN